MSVLGPGNFCVYLNVSEVSSRNRRQRALLWEGGFETILRQRASFFP